MNYEQLAFVNQQLAGMLASGIPLEGALRQVCVNMRRGEFRSQLEALEADLAKGIPLNDAMAARALPEFYVKMIQLGARTNNLPGVLILVADYYQRTNTVWTRLKGLMVYPLIVLVLAVALAAFVAFVSTKLMRETGLESLWDASTVISTKVHSILAGMWAPVAVLLAFTMAIVLGLIVPQFRRRLRWWLPGFREHSLTNFAATMDLMLRSGSHFGEALELAQQLEARSPAGPELGEWKTRLAGGNARIAEIAGTSKVFPPLFVWLVAQGREDLAGGFKRAAAIYHARAVHRIELLLYAALPVSVMILGGFILTELLPLVQVLSLYVDMLGGDW